MGNRPHSSTDRIGIQKEQVSEEPCGALRKLFGMKEVLWGG